MKKFNIEKKNRKYYSATTNGYKCKILIDDNSKDLELGEQMLDVDDISIRSKYGTDLIFKLTGSVSEQEDAGICTLKPNQYNLELTEKCRKLGGLWDGVTSAWVFSGMVEDKVEELDYLYNSAFKSYEIKFDEETFADCGPIQLCGVVLAKATGRDSGVKHGERVAFIDGDFRSGGSAKNWCTIASEGAVLRVEIPHLLLEQSGKVDNLTITAL
jgi:hypothetical protein